MQSQLEQGSIVSAVRLSLQTIFFVIILRCGFRITSESSRYLLWTAVLLPVRVVEARKETEVSKKVGHVDVKADVLHHHRCPLRVVARG